MGVTRGASEKLLFEFVKWPEWRRRRLKIGNLPGHLDGYHEIELKEIAAEDGYNNKHIIIFESDYILREPPFT